MTVAAFVLLSIGVLVLSTTSLIVLFGVVGALSWQRGEASDEWVSMCVPPAAGPTLASDGRSRARAGFAAASSGFMPSGFATSGFHAGRQ